MKPSLFILTACLTGLSATQEGRAQGDGASASGNTQQGSPAASAPATPAAPAAAPATAPTPATPADPQTVQKKLQEAQEFHERQHYVDALAKLDEVEAVAPENPQIYNLRGSIYLTPALRDFDLAREMFLKAAALEPTNLAPQFNLAELLFVKHDWAQARQAFQKLLDNFPKTPQPIRHLIVFKRLVCEAKQGQIETAEQTLKEHFTFMDDTAAYYYSNAAIHFAKKDEATAKDWLRRAGSIFKADEVSAYADSLMEARWIPNIGLPPTEAK